MLELHDGAAIYIIFSKRAMVRGNLVRDVIDTGGYGASAYYLDEQAEDCVVEGNVSESLMWPSQNHMAKKNVIRGNIFICPDEAKLTFPKSSEYMFERNVIVTKGNITFSNPTAVATWTGNVFFNAGGKLEGPPADAVQTDPQLDIRDGVYGFRPTSPALKLGIMPLDMRTVGREQTPGHDC